MEHLRTGQPRHFSEDKCSICDTLESLFPDVIFLQEIISKTLHFIQDRLGSLYQLVPGGEQNAYFILTLVKRSSEINMLHTKIHSFPNTKLGRNLLIVKVTGRFQIEEEFQNFGVVMSVGDLFV
ncbi:tyrosyl-DNA phosphodiesterase 2-like [Strongylocentrotus purpuratus]|uniref:Endonuclease/exonuclease/phosphatase domain-containing protein n=1 Tax=Strongylocentrotus purpuratus TaxID=7668 RepID=A0A7M7N3X3_STRPU|nr:tyrosyl-DNA phosphodiesterase 2-like [Strongylocentrotus purpuratus]